VTARDFAQTLQLCCSLRHRADRRRDTIAVAAWGAKALGLASRSAALARWARGRRFDLAVGHGSNDVSIAAALLRVPSSTAFDYEWATVQHNINCRLARAVVVRRRSRPSGCVATAPVRASSSGTRAEGGVLPVRLRARRGRSGRARARARADAGRRAHTAGRIAVSPLRERSLRPRAAAPARDGRPGGRAAAHNPSSAPSWRPNRASWSPSEPWTPNRWSPTPMWSCRPGAR